MWIVIPSTCSPSAPGTEGSTSDLPQDVTPAQAERLASCVTSNGKLSPPRSWRTAWRRKAWLRLLSGAICEPSTAARGVESWIASLADTRVNRSALRASGRERLTRGTCGPKWLESLRRLNPASCSSRTWEGTYRSGSTMFPVTFTEWATELRRDFSARQKLARRTGGSGCSSSAWPTPRTITGGGESAERKQELGRTISGGGDLQAQAGAWPMAQDAQDAGSVNANMMTLSRASKDWPTPGANDHKGSAKPGQRRGQLDEAPEHCSLPAPEPAPSGSESSATAPTSRPRLNPARV